MTWFRDLSTCDYFDWIGLALSESDRLLAVGWLGEWHEYERGPIDPDVRARLVRMVECPWSPIQFMGYHDCELCVGPGGYVEDVLASGRELANGTANLFVPAGRVVYVVPELVLHYIDEHGYAPPAEFCDALMACPPVWSDEYFAELRRSGSATFNRIVPPQVLPDDDPPRLLAPLRLLKGVTVALGAMTRAARDGSYDRQVAWEVARVVPKVIAVGIEIVSIQWRDGYAEMMVRRHDNSRDPAYACEHEVSDIRERVVDDPFGGPRMIKFVSWRGDPRRDVERRLAPARVDYIGLDPIKGVGKAFLVDDRPPTDHLTRHPCLGFQSPSYGNWKIDIIPRPTVS
jgi:hypothetical protein